MNKILHPFLFIFVVLSILHPDQSEASKILNRNPLAIKSNWISGPVIERGAEVELSIEVILAEKHHAYVKQFRLTPENLDLRPRKLAVSPTVTFYDKLAKKDKLGIKNKAIIKTTFEIPESANQIEKFKLQYQACTEDYCLLPIDLPLSVRLDIPKATATTSTASQSGPLIDLDGKNKSIFLILIAIFFAGLLTSFTPCIYPMIPITLAVLGSSKSNSKVMDRLLLSFSYVLGIAFTYSCLGLLAASTGQLFGAYMNHIYVRIGIVFVFVIMALSMFGLFEIKLSGRIADKLAARQFKKNYFGAFLTGLVAGVIASPCVGPVLVSILTYVSQSQDLFLGFLYLFTFSMGLGTLFIAIGLFSHLLHKLPRSGSWMDISKLFFGFVMLCMALFYLEPILPNRHFWIAVPVLLMITMHFTSKLITKEKLKKAITFVLFSAAIFSSLNVIPQVNSKFTSFLEHFIYKNKLSPKWVTYSDDVYQKAKDKNLGIIIDFYADWCAACIELEKKTFNQPSIHELGKNFLWVKFDATTQGEEFKRLKAKYKIFGLPHVVFYNKNGKHLEGSTLTGFEKEAPFAQRLKSVLDTANTPR